MPLPTLTAKPVERRLLRDVVYERLYNAIIDGTLEPGEVLLDETLTSWLGVSRTPIREALMRLSEIGLVEFSPNRYTRVSPIDLRAIDEALYTIGILAEHAARTAASEIEPESLARLSGLSATVTEHAESDEVAALAAALREFFLELEWATGNAALVSATESLSPQLLRYVSTWEIPLDAKAIAVAVEQIVGALAARDGVRAAESIRLLYEPARTIFLEQYRRTDTEIDAAAVGGPEPR